MAIALENLRELTYYSCKTELKWLAAVYCPELSLWANAGSQPWGFYVWEI